MRHETFSPLLGRRAPSRELIDRVAAWHQLGRADILSKSRRRRLVAARFDAVAAVHAAYPRLSLGALGRIFQRDRTTILNALQSRGFTKRGQFWPSLSNSESDHE